MTNWDNEIDSVALAMTEGEPDPALKARVLARLDRPRASWRPAWILAPIAIAAVVVMGVLLARRPHTIDVARQPDQAVVRRTPDASAQPGTANTPERSTPTGPPVERPRDVVRASSDRPRAVSTFVAFRQSGEVEGLAPPPLEIEPLDVDSMDAMETIQIARLEVAPLEQPAMGEE